MTGLQESVRARVQGFAPGREFRLGLARRTIERLSRGRAIRVLDAGCEDGLLASTLARRNPTWTVVGADINDGALARARAEARSEGLNNLEYVHIDITKPFVSEEYDIVAAIEALIQIPDDAAAVRSLAAALKPSGLLVLHVPLADWRPVLPGSPTRWKGEVRRGYDEADLVAMLEAAGFDRTDVTATTRGTLHAAEEIRERTKHRALKLRALVYPALAAAVPLERFGVTAGTPRALLVTAQRSELARAQASTTVSVG